MPRAQGCNAVGECWSSMFVVHEPVVFVNAGPSMTRQEFAAECDINVLMAHYEKNAVLPPTNRVDPQYFDASEVPDFRDALDIARQAQEAFSRVPAAARKELDNDVHKFVEYAQDEANLPQLRKWGLAEPEKAPIMPMRVEVVNPPSPPPASAAASP